MIVSRAMVAPNNFLMPKFRADMQSLIRRKVNKKLKLPTKPKNSTDLDLAPPAPVPGTSLPTEPAPQVSSPRLTTRSDTRDSRGSTRSKRAKMTDVNGGITAAPAAAVVKDNTGDESEEDSDLDDFAFDHPNTYKDAPWIWIPEVICIQPAYDYELTECVGFYFRMSWALVKRC